MRAGWQSDAIESCLDAVTYTRKIQRKDFLDTGAFPIVSQEADFINGYWDDERDVFRVARPVVIFGDHTRVVKYVDFDFVLGADGVKILAPDKRIDPKFFYYWMTSIDLGTLGYARHYRLLKEQRVSFPSLSEQRHIVGILDEAFDGIAASKANAEKSRQNAKDLFDAVRSNVFAQRDAAWSEVTLDKLAENLDSRRVPITKSDRRVGPYPYYGASGIVDHVADFIFEGDTLLISEDGANLISRTSPIAFPAVGKYWVNNHAHILRFKSDVTQRFVELYMESIKIDEFVTGAAQPKLTQKALNSIPIPIPDSEPVQRRVVSELDSVLLESNRLVALYQQKLAALDELKKSLLHRAFSGQL